MICIKTTMNAFCLDPHELRSIGTASLQDRGANDAEYIEKNYIVLTLKSGERHLISVGHDMLVAVELQGRLTSAICSSTATRNVLTEIDIDQLLTESGDPPFCATKMVSGEEADQILAAALKPRRPARKAIRTKLGQVSVDPDNAVVSTAMAWFLFDDDEYQTGVLSREAYEILNRARFCSDFLREEDDKEGFPLKLGTEFFVKIRSGSETCLICTGEEAEANERIRLQIEEGLLGSDPLIDLRTPEELNACGPRLMSADAAQKLQRFLYEYSESPILP